MRIQKLPIEGLLLITPNVLYDERGCFLETMVEGLPLPHFVQENESWSKKGVLRGLHFQKPPYEQGKLVRVVKGEVLDVAVDLREGSPTKGQHFKVRLNDKGKQMFWIPRGFAHGFLTLSEEAVFVYKCDQVYRKDAEGGLRYDSPALGISWGTSTVMVSERDKRLQIWEP